MTVRVAEGSVTRWQHTTTIYRSDVNAKYHTSGYHGFKASFAAPNGVHSYCVYLLNYGMGNASPRHCYTLTVNGSPVGKLVSVSAPDPGQVAVSGWADDPDVLPAASSVQVIVDADTASASTVLADQPRPAGTYPAAGDHGFDAVVAATAGVHDVCVLALNAGPAGPAAVSLGCLSVTVQAPDTPPAATNPTDTTTTSVPTDTATTQAAGPTDTTTATTSVANPVPSPNGS